MPTSISPLEIRRRLGRQEWSPPTEFGSDGWRFDGLRESKRIIVSENAHPADDEGREWIHASISRGDRVPDYDDLQLLHRAVWGETGWAYQVFAPASAHVNIHPNALHLWGAPDGRLILPNFGKFGSI